jgi:hypothetical protein
MKRFLLLSCLSLAALTGAAQAQVIGSFNVEGQNPDGSGYRGTASVEKTGMETFRVTWVVDGARFIGTGIGNEDVIAVTYRSGNQTGVALMAADKAEVGVVWTYAGGTSVGKERWRRR